MGSARCCPADCALREDWEDELNQVKTELNSVYISHLEEMIKAISHPLRLKILLLLKNRDQCVCEFNWIFDESQTQISNHLKILRDAGIIETYYRSNHKIYKLKEDTDISLITWMHQQWKRNCSKS